MKKIISAALAGALCAGAFVSCGDKEKEKGSKGDVLSTKGKSEYTSIYPLDGNKNELMESIDGGIKYSISRAKEYRKENDTEYNPWVIKFSGNKFVMPIKMSGVDWVYYDGTFSVKNGEIKFSYENFIVPENDTKVNINDNIEYDEDIALGKSEKLDGLSKEERVELIKKEQGKAASGSQIESMQNLNEYGSYCKFAAPLMNASDKWSDFTLLPFIRTTKGVDINIEYSNTLKTIDNFLCTETYGIELDGKYKKGKDFTLKHDLEDTFKENEQSPYQWEEEPEEWLDRYMERAEVQYSCDSLESTIEFSGGKWKWYNADDELLNNGKYEESKKYPGLIAMYLDEDSEKHPEYAVYTGPLWFYIADDGGIYYPAFVKVE